MKAQLMNNELEWIQKEKVMAYFIYYSILYLKELRKIKKKPQSG
jgi:hypothetical protein